MTNSLPTKFVSFLVAMSATTVSFAEVAQAKTVEFAYSPVELADAESAAQLEERINDFARRTCRSNSPLIRPGMERECVEDLAAQLRDQIPLAD